MKDLDGYPVISNILSTIILYISLSDNCQLFFRSPLKFMKEGVTNRVSHAYSSGSQRFSNEITGTSYFSCFIKSLIIILLTSPVSIEKRP